MSQVVSISISTIQEELLHNWNVLGLLLTCLIHRVQLELMIGLLAWMALLMHPAAFQTRLMYQSSILIVDQ
jgi:hypothetical protein